MKIQSRKKRICLEAMGLSVLVAVMRFLFQMGPAGSMAVWGTGLILVPAFDKLLCRIGSAKKEYYEMTVYMEQMICSYKRLGNVRLALEDCVTLFDEGSKMGKALRQALHTLKTGEGVEGKEIVKGALSHIHMRYVSRRMRLLHEYLCSLEKVGGETAEALDILLGDLQMWKRRTLFYQKKKQFIRRECTVAVLLAGGLCYMSRLLVPYNLLEDFTESLFYQVSTALTMAGLLCTEVLILYKLTGSWLDRQAAFAEKKGRRKKKSRWNKKIKWKKKTSLNEAAREFPYWLLSVTLYLQQESVFYAVQQSLEQTYGVFKEEVSRFLECIYDEPSSLIPYTEFFGRLRLPEIQTGMKILYSVNTNGYQDTKRQVRSLVEQNNILIDTSESNRLKNRITALGMLRQIPMLIAGIKIVSDMVTLFTATMGEYMQML